MEVLGTVVRLQVQRSPLKPGPVATRVYDPTPLAEVTALEVTPRGVTGDGLLDVHHADHALSRNRRLDNGLSAMTREGYRLLRAAYGDHLVDGIAGESLLVDGGLDLRGPLQLETTDGVLDVIGTPIPPCVEFSRFALGGATGTGPEVLAALEQLGDGARGYYLSTQGFGRVEAGHRLLRA